MSPIVQYIDLILEKALAAYASDIHFEPFENNFRIRFRADGSLYELPTPPLELASSLISRIKVMSNLDVAETRVPQDGRIQHKLNGRCVDLRVSTLPTAFGESVVLRVLDHSLVNLELESLGMPDPIYKEVCQAITKPNGIFIATGPTGSGKTTTLYSCLRKINTLDSKILTVEDPVEYDIDGLMQVAINESIGLSFSKTLRAFLRHDPDSIMIGEIRDYETAQIAIQAALTGHLVFTTLHTNDTASTITRFLDMGIEPFLLSTTLESILAQRLIRRLCPHCRSPYHPTNEVIDHFRKLEASRWKPSRNEITEVAHKQPQSFSDTNTFFYYSSGCKHCDHTGYKGRIALFELLSITNPLRELINKKATSSILHQKAIEQGMLSLQDHALQLIHSGQTSLEEATKYLDFHLKPGLIPRR